MLQIVNQFKNWLFQSPNRRRADRFDQPSTIAYCWDGSVPVPRELRDISLTGAYLETSERWYPGTIIKLTLKTNQPGIDPSGESVVVRCKVVRHGADGIGLHFISQEENERKELDRFLTGLIASLRGSQADSTDHSAKRTRTKAPGERGSTLVEFSLVLLLQMGALFLMMDIAWIFFGWACIQEAAREGVRYAVTGSSQTESSLDSNILNNAIMPFSFGFVNAQNASSVVSIDYYPSNGYSPTGAPASLDGQANATAAGNVVRVTIRGISISSFCPILRSATPITLSASAADVMQ